MYYFDKNWQGEDRNDQQAVSVDGQFEVLVKGILLGQGHVNSNCLHFDKEVF